jgi:hypothetical protein
MYQTTHGEKTTSVQREKKKFDKSKSKKVCERPLSERVGERISSVARALVDTLQRLSLA